MSDPYSGQSKQQPSKPIQSQIPNKKILKNPKATDNAAERSFKNNADYQFKSSENNDKIDSKGKLLNSGIEDKTGKLSQGINKNDKTVSKLDDKNKKQQNKENVKLLPEKLVDEDNDDQDDGNNDFTDEEIAKLSKFFNKINSKADDDNDDCQNQDKEYQVVGHSNMNENIQVIDGAHFYFPKMNKKFVIYDKKSCYLFKHDGWIRKKIVWLSCWPWFDNFIITLILVNSIMLALFDYKDRDALTEHNQMIEFIGQIFTWIFTVECLIKIIAMGFFMHKNSYLRDYWNWLDFIVVCIGIFENIPGIPKLKALRTMRVLRPLRSVNAVPQMRKLIGSLLASIPELGNAVLFMFFIFLLFGILGVQQFKGTLYQRCRMDPMPTYKIGDTDPSQEMWYWDKADDVDRLCSLVQDEGNFMCPAEYTCGSPTHSNALSPMSLPFNYTAPLMLTEDFENDENIAYNIANFNDIIWAMETIFVMITLEGWSGLMYNLSDASMSWMAIAYCILLVVFGSFFLLNVILAVIMDSFEKENNPQAQKLIEEHKKLQIKAQKEACGIYDTTTSESENEKQEDNQSQKSNDDDLQVNLNPGINQNKNTEANLLKVKNLAQSDTAQSQIEMVQPTYKNYGSNEILDFTHNIQKVGPAVEPSVEEHLLKSGDENQTQKLLLGAKHLNDSEEILKLEKNSAQKFDEQRKSKLNESSQSKKEEIKSKFNENQDECEDTPKRVKDNRLFKFFYQVCMHDLFTVSMTIAILVNTGVLAFDSYPISYLTQTYLDILNQVLSYIFIGEMVIKLIGLGISEYCSDNFNIFDGTVVIISVIEMVIESFIDGGLGGGAISSLRAVRLLRVFKLARSWTSFRDLLQKMIITLKDIQFFAFLLVLFMFIFTLLGMELFAYRIKYDNEDKEKPIDSDDVSEGFYPRASFNTFGLGFTTIFIVFIGEDWNSVMYDHYRSQGVGCLLIFILFFIVGNLIMLNLFLAILLKNFEEPPGKEEEVIDKGPSTMSIVKQKLVQILCQCCSCCKKQDERKISDENQAAESMFGKGNHEIKNSEYASDAHNVITPRSRKSAQSQHISDKDISQKGNVSQNDKDEVQNLHLSPENAIDQNFENMQYKSDQEIAVKAQTEVKNKSYGKELLDDQNSKLTEMKKSHGKTYSEHKRVTLDIQDAIKSPSQTRKFLKQRTQEMSEKSSATQRFSISAIKQMEVEAAEKPKRKPLIVTGKSLFIMSPQNAIRRFSVWIVGQEHFDNTILFLILFSTIMLILESPLNDPKSEMADNLFYIDIVVTALFTIELILKVIVLGFLMNGPESYIRNAWNQMDFVIVAISLISIIFRDAGSQISVLKMLRMLRVLRPLRMISRNPGLKIAVNSLINSIPYIRDVIVVCLLFLLLFAILCVNFFKGTFFTCQVNDDMLGDLPEPVAVQLQQNIDEHVQTKFQCLDYGGEWVNQDSNFDNVGQSMITLFNIMTTEGWIDVMWTAVDSSKIHFVPETQEFGFSVFGFIIIIFFFHLFILNMFVGIVINVFSDEKKTLELNHLLTQTQIDWCEVLIFCYKSQPEIKFLTTGNCFKDSCYSIAMNTYFDRFILICIILNTGCLAYTWHGEPPNIQQVLDQFNLVFNIIYTIEAGVKLVAFDKNYFKDGWNTFDFIIVTAAWFGFISSQIEGLDIGTLTNVIRIFRISRIFKIIKKYKSLRILFYTFIGAIPQLTNVGGLLILFLFLYSVLGVEWFSTVKLQEELTVHANFRTFPSALSTLFRMATGESWQAIMYDCARPRSVIFDCIPKPQYEDMYNKETGELDINGCGDQLLAYLYFISFMLMVSFIFLNLFIAIILESFASSMDEEGLQIGEETINKFKEFWSDDRFDPKGTKFISIAEFPEFLKLIIDEEIKQEILYDEKLKNGEISVEDQVGSKIFMFNLHIILINQQQNIYKDRRQKILQQMIENEDIGDTNQLDDTTKQGEIDDDYNDQDKNEENNTPAQEGGGPDESEQERIRRKKINEEKIARQIEEKFKKILEQIIRTMEMPCYDKCKTFYYYDVLEALSRHLFQTIINQKKKKLEEELGSDSDSSDLDRSNYDNVSNQSNGGRQGKSGDKKDSDTSDEEFEYKMTERELEDREDILFGSLEEILRKLEEEKGAENPDIEKYKEMRLWRQKRDKTVREQLEQFAHDGKDGKKRSIIDSSQLVGARVIMKYLKRKQDRKRNGVKDVESDQPKEPIDKNEAENIKARRDARVLEIEVQRKKKRMACMSPDDDFRFNQMNPLMPKIHEAENEDKDYSNDNKGQKMKKSRNNSKKGTNPPFDLDLAEGDAAYSTFQKDSEPGNRQGDEAPNFGNKFYEPENYENAGSDGQISQQVQMITMKNGNNGATKQSQALEGSSFEEYHQYESSEMQDIQSLNSMK